MRRLVIGILALALTLGPEPASAMAERAYAAGGAFEPAGTLKGGWVLHVAATLPDGRVLIVGGTGRRGVFDSGRVWDPAMAWLGKTAPLLEPRTLAAGVTLADGRVLIVGGDARGGPVPTAELWDPGSDTFSSAGKLEEARIKADAIVLADGRVAVIGGSGPDTVRGIEIWDPEIARFHTAAVMPEPREDHASVLLPDGRVLITGGGSERGPLKTALLWDPVSGEVSDAGQMSVDRYDHTATLLPDGHVIIIGGWTEGGRAVTAEAELWDPVTNTFGPAGSMASRRASHTATPLPDGRILVVGGSDQRGHHPVASEVWDPALSRFVPSGPLAFGREGHTASLLPDGRVLVVGGQAFGADVESPGLVEVWDPDAVPELSAPPARLNLAACSADEVDPGTTALLEQFPTELEGVPLEPQACAGPAWLAMHDPDDPGTAVTIDRAQTLVDAAGRSIDDLTVAAATYELEPGRITTITALRIEGARAGRLADPVVALLLGIERPDKRYRYVGQGRFPVTKVRDATIPGSDAVTMYAPVGDTLWFLTADEPGLLERVVEALPGPGGRFHAPELGIAITFPQDWIVSALTPAGTADGSEAPYMGPDALAWPIANGRAPGSRGQFESCGLNLFTSTGVAPTDAFEVVLPDHSRQAWPAPEDLGDGLLRVTGPGSLLGESGYVAVYVLGSDDSIVVLRCTAQEASSDQWLSLARTIEFPAATE